MLLLDFSRGAEIEQTDKVLNVVVKYFSPRLLAIRTQEQAESLYLDAGAMPQSNTTAEIKYIQIFIFLEIVSGFYLI